MQLGRLMQVWHRLSMRERTLAGVALVVVFFIAGLYGIVDPYFAYTARIEDDIELDIQRLAKMQRLRDRGPQVAEQVRGLQQRFEATRQRLIPGETPSLAAAHLQERIQTLANQSGLELVTTQVMRDEAVGAFRMTTVQVTLRGELSEAANFLAGIEYGDWLLSVETLEVRSTYRRRRSRRIRRRQAIRSQNALTITMQVGGIMQGAQPLTVARGN